MIGLLDKPTSGKVILDHTETTQLTDSQVSEYRNKKLGFVFQFSNLLQDLTVLENVMLPLEMKNNRKAREIAEKYLEKVDMLNRVMHYPQQLSGGEQQRVAIARALVGEPAILLVDEPTGNLDSKSGDQVIEVLQQLNDKGTTICMVTHDVRYAKLASRQLQLLDGNLCEMTSEDEAAAV